MHRRQLQVRRNAPLKILEKFFNKQRILLVFPLSKRVLVCENLARPSQGLPPSRMDVWYWELDSKAFLTSISASWWQGFYSTAFQRLPVLHFVSLKQPGPFGGKFFATEKTVSAYCAFHMNLKFGGKSLYILFRNN